MTSSECVQSDQISYVSLIRIGDIHSNDHQSVHLGLQVLMSACYDDNRGFLSCHVTDYTEGRTCGITNFFSTAASIDQSAMQS